MFVLLSIERCPAHETGVCGDYNVVILIQVRMRKTGLVPLTLASIQFNSKSVQLASMQFNRLAPLTDPCVFSSNCGLMS